MNKKQIAVSAASSCIMGYLYYLPVKGLIKPKTTKPDKTSVDDPLTTAKLPLLLRLIWYLQLLKPQLGRLLTAKINDLEGQVKKTHQALMS
jgi:hypothetical protein